MGVVLPGRGAGRTGQASSTARCAQRPPCIHAGAHRACSPQLALLAPTSLLPWGITTWGEPCPRDLCSAPWLPCHLQGPPPPSVSGHSALTAGHTAATMLKTHPRGFANGPDAHMTP